MDENPLRHLMTHPGDRSDEPELSHDEEHFLPNPGRSRQNVNPMIAVSFPCLTRIGFSYLTFFISFFSSLFMAPSCLGLTPIHASCRFPGPAHSGRIKSNNKEDDPPIGHGGNIFSTQD